MTPVLQGTRVLDFGRYIAGPYCAALLAELGADVIRVEKRDGSEDRFELAHTLNDEQIAWFKAGSALNLLRWASPRTIKENFNPPRSYRYGFMG